MWQKIIFEKIILSLLFMATYFVSIFQPAWRSRIIVVTGIMVLLYILVCHKSTLKTDRLTRLWLLTLAVIFFSMLFSSIDRFYLLFYVVFTIVLLVFRDEKTDWFKWGIKLIYIMGVVYAGFTIIQVIFGTFYTKMIVPLLVYNSTFDPARFMRFGIYSGLTYQTAVNATYLAFGIGAAFVTYLFSEKRRWIHLLVIGIEVVCIMLSGKRAHVLFSGMALLFVAFYNGTRSKRFANILKIIVALFILFVLGYYFIPSAGYFYDRVLNPMDDITNGRIDRYIPALELFKTHPVFGIGWGQFKYTYSRLSNVHNIYLQLLCETGIVGTFIFFAVFVWALVDTVRKLNYTVRNQILYEREALSFSLFGQIFFLLYGLTGNGLYDYYILFFYMFSILLLEKCKINQLQRATI